MLHCFRAYTHAHQRAHMVIICLAWTGIDVHRYRMLRHKVVEKTREVIHQCAYSVYARQDSYGVCFGFSLNSEKCGAIEEYME